jgi:hypothetical protein
MPTSLRPVYIISGRITNLPDQPGEDGSIPEGLVVRAFEVSKPKKPVLLGEHAVNTAGLYQIRFSNPSGANGDLHVMISVFDGDDQVGKSKPRRMVKNRAKIDLQVNLPDMITPATYYLVEGKVTSPLKFKTGKLRVEIVDKNVKEDIVLDTTLTNAAGAYQFRFTDLETTKSGKDKLDLQVRVYTEKAAKKHLATSEIRYNASAHEIIDIQLDQKAIDDSISDLQSDYGALIGTLSEQFDVKPGDIPVDDGGQKIAYLANKTGWDARAIEQAVQADRLSDGTKKDGKAKIEPAFFYALFEAGLPTDPDLLYQVDAGSAEAVWKKAIEKGVISAELAELPEVIKQYKQLANQQVLRARALRGVSSLQDMLSFSLGPDEGKHKKFAELYTQYAEDPKGFWTRVKKVFPVEGERLELDGQLAYLTINNVPLMEKIHKKIQREVDDKGMSRAEQLVQVGLYDAKNWEPLIGDGLIPPEVTGKDQAEIKSNYASMLAAQVRFSFPTAVVADMIKNDDILRDKKGNSIPGELRDQVHSFLVTEQAEFEIGSEPIEQYLKRKKKAIEPRVVKEITRIQRVHQLVANDHEARNALLKKGLDSAYAIAHYERNSFVRAFKDEVGVGEAKARQLHARAEHVHNAVLNIAISYLTASRAPGVGVHSPAQIVNPVPTEPDPASDIIAYPTLENLLGGMDFCNCEHCRSVLSPAAYLVDLLSFLDRDKGEWEKLLEDWKKDHEPAPYPYTKDEWEKPDKPPDVTETPLQVLLKRRPDLEHLQLTCENTNVPLPYIDLVNEILEYYVANDLSLDNYAGHTTDSDAKPEELLADPQFVSDRAYQILTGKVQSDGSQPLLAPKAPLPFHRPLEYLRRYFYKFEAPLPDVMEELCKDNRLERGDATYGWRDILMEELRLSRAEYDLLSKREAPNDTTDVLLTLKTLYGFSPALPEDDLRIDLSKAKSFCRTVGITYEELIRIIQTRFCNPNSALLSRLENLGYSYLFPKLEKLEIDFVTIQKLKDGELSDDQFNSKLPADLDKTPYDGNVAEWIKENFEQIVGYVGVTFQSIKDLKEKKLKDSAFKALLPLDEIDITRFGGQASQSDDEKYKVIKRWILARYDQIMALILLINPTRSTDMNTFDNFELRYAEPDQNKNSLQLFEFIRLIRFIRLWKKLGWTIEQTDLAISALYPADHDPNNADDAANLQKLDAGFLILLPRLGVIKRVIRALNLNPKRDLQSLLACFAPIDTHHGSLSLYQQIFPYALRKQAPVFENNGYGEFLTDEKQTLEAYIDVVRAALGLAGEEYRAIVADPSFNTRFVSVPYTHPQPTLEQDIQNAAPGINYDADKQHLTYRGILSLATQDALNKVAGVSDSFKTAVGELFNLYQSATTSLSLENVSALFRRGWLARMLKMSVPELLLLSRFSGLDPFSPPDAPELPILRFLEFVDRLRALSLKPAQALYLIWDQDLSGRSAPEENEVTSFARALRLDLMTIEKEFVPVPDPDGQIARARMALVYGNEVTDLFFGLLSKSVITEVEYPHDDKTLNQSVLDAHQLAFDKFRKRLIFKAGIVPQSVLDAVKNEAEEFKKAVQELYGKTRNLLDRYPELLTLHDQYFDSQGPEEQRRTILLASILPELKRRRKRQQVLQSTSAATGASIELTSALLDTQLSNKNYILHAVGDPSLPALRDITAVETASLSEQLIQNDDKTVSGTRSGYLEAPENGFYNLLVEVDEVATVKLNFEGRERNDFQPTVSRLGDKVTTWQNQEPIELQTGFLYPISIAVEKSQGKFNVLWERTGHGREVIPGEFLYSETLIDHLRQTYNRFLKVVSLAGTLKLSPAEMVYLGGPGWLNSLPVRGDPDLNTSQALFKALRATLDYARLKTELAPNDERLLAVLQDPDAKTPNADSLLLTLTRWDASSLDSLLSHFGHPDHAALKDLKAFRRVHDAFAWVKKLGIPASSLIKAATNEPDAVTIRDLQAALRARYSQSDWLNLLRPINDELRSLQRDALVAYILHQMQQTEGRRHIDTPDKLFEFFLMDVQMEPCMQTSRIRYAISTVQLFIDRCLMNLERRVAPSVISAKHWEWMNRYRVWEANRKVFLYPENWLEPELRDDQSPFFKETMSELLQSEITEESATTAMLNYLSKLEEVAKLEPCGIHYIKDNPNTDAPEDVAHVVARTAGGNRKYYYRRCEFGSWTPWEQIKLDIEDDPVTPVVWNGRLFLFWLRVLQNTDTDLSEGVRTPQQPKISVQVILCWSEYYNGKWQPMKTSDITNPATGKFDLSANKSVNRSIIHLNVFQQDGALWISPSGRFQTGDIALFILHNTHGNLESMSGFDASKKLDHRFGAKRTARKLEISSRDRKFSITYNKYPRQSLTSSQDDFTYLILKAKEGTGTPGTSVQPTHQMQYYLDFWETPFFYEDDRHVFYVTSTAFIDTHPNGYTPPKQGKATIGPAP